MIPDFTVPTFRGLNTFIKDLKTLKPGVHRIIWITGKYGEHIELRRGSQLLGQTRETGAGNRARSREQKNGRQIPFFTTGRKAKYYGPVTDDMIEISSDEIAGRVAHPLADRSKGADVPVAEYFSYSLFLILAMCDL